MCIPAVGQNLGAEKRQCKKLGGVWCRFRSGIFCFLRIKKIIFDGSFFCSILHFQGKRTKKSGNILFHVFLLHSWQVLMCNYILYVFYRVVTVYFLI